MAIVTDDALFSPVRIVLRMTVVAGHTQRYLEYRLDMAVLAFDRGMRAEECIARVVVVIEEHVGPDRGCVAGTARFTEVPFVTVVLEVARDTSGLELVGERVLRMAVSAGEFRVTSVERE